MEGSAACCTRVAVYKPISVTLDSGREACFVAGEAAGGRLRGGPRRLAGGRARRLLPSRSRVALTAAFVPAVSRGHARGLPHLRHSLSRDGLPAAQQQM